MIRTLFLILSLLAVAVVPESAHARGGGHGVRGHRGHHGHPGHFHHFGGVYAPSRTAIRAGQRRGSGSTSSTWTDPAATPMCRSGSPAAGRAGTEGAGPILERCQHRAREIHRDLY